MAVVLDNPPALAAAHQGGVSEEIFSGDAMFDGNRHAYFSCGASALAAILAAQALAGVPAPSRVLDFGSGAGRVTRWLRSAFPQATVECTDVREPDLDFCRQALGAVTWASGTNVTALEAPASYDLLWAGSVLTHLSERKALVLIGKFLSWLAPGGLAVFTLHGRRVVDYHYEGHVQYIEPGRWGPIEDGFNNAGFGYVDYKKRNGYGMSLTKLSWTAARIEAMEDVRLVALSEHAWDNHQDVVALQKV